MTYQRHSLQSKSRLLTAACLATAATAACNLARDPEPPRPPLGKCAPAVVCAASPSPTDVQAAIWLADEGDTVRVPAGTSTWRSTVVIQKHLTLEGSGIGQTVIIHGRDRWFTGALAVILEGQPFRITGFTFRGSGTPQEDDADHIIVLGSSRGFRIDHNRFEDGGAHSVWIRGDIYGVIDHNEFVNPSREVVSIVDRDGGDDSWNRPLALGSDQAVYIEDNSFSFDERGDHAVTGDSGARYVFRYNSISSAAHLNASQVDVHGNFFTYRGTRSFEIYGNELYSEDSFQGMYIRGGTGVIYDNRFTGTYDFPIIFANYRSFATPSGEQPGPCGYSACEHPAPDQIQDTYVWGNLYQAGDAVPYVQDRGLEREHIQLGRDYFLAPRPDYTPYTYPHPLTTK